VVVCEREHSQVEKGQVLVSGRSNHIKQSAKINLLIFDTVVRTRYRINLYFRSQVLAQHHVQEAVLILISQLYVLLCVRFGFGIPVLA